MKGIEEGSDISRERFENCDVLDVEWAIYDPNHVLIEGRLSLRDVVER